MKRFFLGLVAFSMTFAISNLALAKEASQKQPIIFQQTENGEIQMAVVPKFESEKDFKNFMDSSADNLQWIPLVETTQQEMEAIDSDIEGGASNSWYFGWYWGSGYRYYRPYYSGYYYYRYPYYGYWGYPYQSTYYYYGRPYYYCWW